MLSEVKLHLVANKSEGLTLVCVMTRVKTECDLELLSFIAGGGRGSLFVTECKPSLWRWGRENVIDCVNKIKCNECKKWTDTLNYLNISIRCDYIPEREHWLATEAQNKKHYKTNNIRTHNKTKQPKKQHKIKLIKNTTNNKTTRH